MLAKHSRWVVSYCFSALVRERDHYSTGLDVSFGFSCSNTQPVWTLHASVSSVMCPP